MKKPRRRLTPRQKETILERDGYVCFYCLDNATEVDHIIPHSYYPDDGPGNLVASCATCNQLAGDKIFASLREKWEFIKKKRGRLNYRYRSSWHYPRAVCPGCGIPFRPGISGTNIMCNRCANSDYRIKPVMKQRDA